MSGKVFNMEMNIAKAIGILAIVAGHCRWDIFGGLFPSASFHVPLFFFISGYFFKKEIIEVGNTIKNYLLYVKKTGVQVAFKVLCIPLFLRVYDTLDIFTVQQKIWSPADFGLSSATTNQGNRIYA